MKIAAVVFAIGLIVLAFAFVRRQRPSQRGTSGDGDGSGGTQFYASDTGRCATGTDGSHGCADGGSGGDSGGGGGDGGGGGGGD